MSFYFEDDDSVAAQGDEFLCPNCGGSESYTDSGGTIFCSLCFAQSQTQTNEGELEHDEVEALIGRGHRGQMLGITYLNGRKYSERKRKRPPNEAFDKSKPLPSLEECLAAYTRVIKVCMEAVCGILKLNQHEAQVVQTAVRTFWLNYLEFWQEGADFYNKHHEDLHLTMRAEFLGSTYNLLLRRFLYHRAKEILKKEGYHGQDSDDDDDSDQSEGKADEEEKDKREFAPRASILVRHTYPDRRGLHEAALYVRPDMESVASFLLSAFCRLGVTARHLVGWIANGKVPLHNAFKQCLSTEQQSRMDIIKNAFVLKRLILPCKVELKTKLLLVVAGHEPTLFPPESIPLLTTRLVADFHWDERVLNLALALLGKKQQVTQDAKANWLPLPLEQLQPIKNQIQVLAAIVVACKLTRGWEFRKYLGDGASIPWTEREAMYTEVPLESYAEFVERHILDDGQDDPQSSVPDFLRDVSQKKASVAQESKPSPIVLTGEPNPNMPRRRNLQNLHEWNLIVRKRKAVWVDANGFGRYVVYAEKRVPFFSTHPHYQAMIEYMAHVADVRAVLIHNQVMDLDHEIYCRWKEVRYPRRVRRRRKANSRVPVGEANDKSSQSISSSMPKSEVSSAASRAALPDSDSDDDRFSRHSARKRKAERSSNSASSGDSSSLSRNSPSNPKLDSVKKALTDDIFSSAQNDSLSGSDTERSLDSQDEDRVPGSQAIF